MKQVMASAGLLALGVLGAGSIQADSLLPEAGPAEKPWTIEGLLRGFYDSNYQTAPKNEPGVSVASSLGFEIAPTIRFNLPGNPATTLTAAYTFDLRYYDDRPSNKADYNQNFQFNLDHRFNDKYDLTLSELFVVDQEPQLLDPTFGTVSRVQGNNIANSAGAKLTGQFSPVWGGSLDYENQLWDYSETGPGSPAATLNRMNQTITAESTWQVGPETTAILGDSLEFVNYTSDDFLFPAIPANPPGVPVAIPANGSPNLRNQILNAIYVGASQNFSRTLFGSARVGAQWVDNYNSSELGTDWGPYVAMTGSWIYMQGGAATLNFNVSRNQTDVQGTSINDVTSDQLSEQVNATIQQQITPKLSGAFNGTFQNSEYQGGSVDGEVDHIWALGLQAIYQFNQYFSAQAGYNYDKVESNIPFRGYDRNRVYIGVTAMY